MLISNTLLQPKEIKLIILEKNEAEKSIKERKKFKLWRTMVHGQPKIYHWERKL